MSLSCAAISTKFIAITAITYENCIHVPYYSLAAVLTARCVLVYHCCCVVCVCVCCGMVDVLVRQWLSPVAAAERLHELLRGAATHTAFTAAVTTTIGWLAAHGR
jgi:hypothetical protein